MGRVVSREELPQLLGKQRKDQLVVFTNGCFDLLHVGHVRYLQEAKALGSILVVALNTDQSVQKLKGPNRPVQSEADRAEIMAALGCVDFVVLFGEETPLKVIQELKPDILVKGGDYKIQDIVGSELVMSYGGKVQSLQFYQGKSTTGLINKSHS